MATVTSLFICISYIYTYFYNFNSLSFYIPIACQFFSVTCSMSLVYPLSILFMYSYFYILHIPILITCSSFTLVMCLFNVPILCQVTYHVSSPCLFHTFGSMIYCILHFHTCTIVYFHVICVHLVLFISCYPVLFIYFIYICMFLFYLSYTLDFCILSVLFLCLYTYFHIKLYCTSCSCNCLCLYHVLFHVVATRPSYSFHLPFSFLYFLYFTCSYPFRVLYFVLSIYCIHVLFISYTVFLLYFSYDGHILCFSSYTVIYYTFI